MKTLPLIVTRVGTRPCLEPYWSLNSFGFPSRYQFIPTSSLIIWRSLYVVWWPMASQWTAAKPHWYGGSIPHSWFHKFRPGKRASKACRLIAAQLSQTHWYLGHQPIAGKLTELKALSKATVCRTGWPPSTYIHQHALPHQWIQTSPGVSFSHFDIGNLMYRLVKPSSCCSTTNCRGKGNKPFIQGSMF